MNTLTGFEAKPALAPPIPIVDLFAGPGGLGEGFSSVRDGGATVFEIKCSIEKDPVAYRTLLLRSAFRHLRSIGSTIAYYDFVTGRISEEDFHNQPHVAAAFAAAAEDALCQELGKADAGAIDARIRTALNGASTWVLIGGPPCQAYSLAGRARRTNDRSFAADEKHFLYREYLRIIREHKPPVFVMENVKGMLSSMHRGDPIFSRIFEDLSSPALDLSYELRSFVTRDFGFGLAPSDFIIESEHYGVPQNRHRVLLLGIRKDMAAVKHQLLMPHKRKISVAQIIGDMPKLRSRLSKQPDSVAAWRDAVALASSNVGNVPGYAGATERVELMRELPTSSGAPYIATSPGTQRGKTELRDWLHDSNLLGVTQHESRSHMASDLARYLFAARFAEANGYSPKLRSFPARLLPAHVNARDARTETVPFMDRFRVQCADQPSTTIVSHIAKDGHYYIHYDPYQCRSLTVREAARLQTFPDNYFFMGNRTQQYTQVGNAVPPYLAKQLAESVAALLHTKPIPSSTS